MIELENVTKRYGRRGAGPDALRDVTLQVPAGSAWAVVGPNGAGKSTLLSLVLGFHTPSAGRVRVDSVAPRDYLRDHGAGYLQERFSLPPEWRAGEALRMLARLEGAGADADRVIALFGLEAHLNKRAGELSRGLLQRVGLAQALIGRRQLVVLDEPTEGLDPIWRIRLRDILADVRRHGCTVLLASHDLGEVQRTADRAIVLDDGRVREVMDTRDGREGARYRVLLAEPFAGVRDIFPDADMDGNDAFTVVLAGAHELSQRIGALIALGGVIAGIEQSAVPLEARVQDILDGESQ